MNLDSDAIGFKHRWLQGMDFKKVRSAMRRKATKRRQLHLVLLFILAVSSLLYLAIYSTPLPWRQGSASWWGQVVKTSDWMKGVSYAEPELESEYPPLFGEYHQAELNLPQHNLDLPFPEGRNGRYLFVGNHQRSVGWGNVLQEMLLIHYLSFKSGRTFVFDNYTWNGNGSDYTEYNGKLIPSRMPLTTLIRGPTAGAPYATAPGMPRSVKKEFWDIVCPNPTKIINDDVIQEIGWDASAKTIVDKYTQLLSTDDPCIETPADTWPIFDIYMFGDHTRLLDVWDDFSTSPIMKEYGFSALVEGAFDKNRAVFAPSLTIPRLTSQPFTTMAERYPAVPGLLVLHIRRGDFAEHCKTLAYWRSTFTGYNSFPALPDKFVAPANDDEQERLQAYLPHCYPSIEDIVKRVNEMRETEAGQGLQDVYVMTNGDVEWVADLKAALRLHSGPWRNVASSRDLVVTREEKQVKQALDMLIGQRAQVFVGNGFSSLSGLVVMLRMATGIPADHNRSW